MQTIKIQLYFGRKKTNSIFDKKYFLFSSNVIFMIVTKVMKVRRFKVSNSSTELPVTRATNFPYSIILTVNRVNFEDTRRKRETIRLKFEGETNEESELFKGRHMDENNRNSDAKECR